ncbi:MAG TPA: hypothetical protein VIG62_18415 [Blastocatellia bacterium]
MNVKVVKPGQQTSKEEAEKPVRDVDILQTVQSWVKEFKSRKFDQGFVIPREASNSGE